MTETFFSPSAAGGAPVDAQYLVLSADSTLTVERVFTPGTALSAVDAGAGNAYTLNVNVAVLEPLLDITNLGGALDDIVGTANEVNVAAGADTIIGGDVTLTLSSTMVAPGTLSVPDGTLSIGANDTTRGVLTIFAPATGGGAKISLYLAADEQATHGFDLWSLDVGGNGDFRIFHVGTGPQTWTFDEDGTTVLPGDLTVAGSLLVDGDQIGITADADLIELASNLLTINGTLTIEHAGSPSLRFSKSGTPVWFLTSNPAASDNLEFRTSSGGGLLMSLSSGGNVFINGTIDPDGKITAAASSTGSASMNIPSGTAPTSPNNGDIWSDGSDLLMRLGGTTYKFDKTAI